MSKSYPVLAILLASLVLVACDVVDEEDISPLRVRSVGVALGLTGDPTTLRLLPSIADPKAQLGMKLFYSKALGLDQDAACVSCHHPVLGGADDLSLPIGVDAENPDLVGPGRFHLSTAPNYDGGPTVARNAPTTFNAGMWDRVMTYDGRIESLDKFVNLNGSPGDFGFGIVTPDSATDDLGNLVVDPNAGANLPTALARFPVTSVEDMRGFDFLTLVTNDDVRNELAARLATYEGWRLEFAAVYGDDIISYDRIAEALGEYVRSQVFVNSPWKAFMLGDDTAISEAARRGALLFMLPTRVDGASCISCHRGDFFTDELFHVLAMPQIGRGKGDGETGTDDFGRFRITGADNDLYAFRTPSLLNVTETGPWGHAGAYTSLEAVIRHHLDPQTAVNTYDFNQLEASIVSSGQTDDMLINTQKALDKLALNRLIGIFSVPILELSDEQIGHIIEFLKTLTDPCVQDRACLAPWIPDATVADPDGLRLNAVDANLNPL
ncbi:MAG: cytochrome c peroxidase [Gammaproteobacteria bacterium]